MLTQSETLMYLLAGLLAVEHAAASPCMLLAASSDADCESLCDGCRCAGGAWQVLGNAAYTNAALDTTTTLLTWSGSDYGNGEPSTCDLCGGACACSSEIPTTLVSLWFTTLTYRRC